MLRLRQQRRFIGRVSRQVEVKVLDRRLAGVQVRAFVESVPRGGQRLLRGVGNGLSPGAGRRLLPGAAEDHEPSTENDESNDGVYGDLPGGPSLAAAHASFLIRSLDGLPDAQAAFHQAGQVVEGDHVGTVAQGLVRPGMRLQKDAVAAAGDRRPRQVRHHPPVPVAAVAASSWHLYAVSGVKDHRAAQILHPRDGPHVADQLAIAEGGAPLGQQQPAIARPPPSWRPRAACPTGP